MTTAAAATRRGDFVVRLAQADGAARYPCWARAGLARARLGPDLREALPDPRGGHGPEGAAELVDGVGGGAAFLPTRFRGPGIVIAFSKQRSSLR